MVIKKRQLNSYLGAIHIHSDFSDGTGDVVAISLAAKAAGLNWVIITDHDNFDIKEGFYNGVCVIKGEEISPKTCNHYLALGIKNVISSEITPSEYVQEVRHQGGFGFVAHPDESDSRKNSNKPIKWLDKTIIPDGIEIWNWFSTWGDNYSDKNIFKLIYAYLFKHRLITKPKEETLKWWDELNNNSEKIVPAVGGVDAHALKINKYIIPVTIFPYKELFETITNVAYLDELLSDNFDRAKEQILNSIKAGRILIVNRHLCKEIPEIYVESANTSVYSGGSVNLDDKTYINVKLHKKFGIKLFFEGKLIWNKKSKELKIPLNNKGKYRVEVEKGKLGYAYSNPIIIN